MIGQPATGLRGKIGISCSSLSLSGSFIRQETPDREIGIYQKRNSLGHRLIPPQSTADRSGLHGGGGIVIPLVTACRYSTGAFDLVEEALHVVTRLVLRPVVLDDRVSLQRRRGHGFRPVRRDQAADRIAVVGVIGQCPASGGPVGRDRNRRDCLLRAGAAASARERTALYPLLESKRKHICHSACYRGSASAERRLCSSLAPRARRVGETRRRSGMTIMMLAGLPCVHSGRTWTSCPSSSARRTSQNDLSATPRSDAHIARSVSPETHFSRPLGLAM